MYNGIGLTTPRGSGTNGYVQRNVAFVKRAKEHVDYKSEAELRKADELMFKEPNKEILEHERKRRIELKCAEMEELMEEQGFDADEIRRKVSNFRKFLAVEDEELQKRRHDAVAAGGKPIFPSVAKDSETGRPVAKGTHEIMAARQQQAEQMRDALKIRAPASDAGAPASAAVAAAAALPFLRSDSDSSDSDSDAGSAAAVKKAKKDKKEKKDKKKKKKAKRSKRDKKEKEKEKKAAAAPALAAASASAAAAAAAAAGKRERHRDRSRSPVRQRSDKRK